jgi:predicted DCC family thiol-disulfide oxidoreductase YuxK
MVFSLQNFYECFLCTTTVQIVKKNPVSKKTQYFLTRTTNPSTIAPSTTGVPGDEAWVVVVGHGVGTFFVLVFMTVVVGLPAGWLVAAAVRAASRSVFT